MSNSYYIRTVAIGSLLAFIAGSMSQWFTLATELILILYIWLPAMLFIGAMFAPLPIIFGTKKWGNNMMFIPPIIATLIAVIIAAFAIAMEPFYIAYFFAGIGLGGTTITVLTYFAEISDPTKRVVALGSVNVSIILGKLVTYVCMIEMSELGYSLLLAAIFVVSAILCVFLLPQSPYFLMQKMREPEAVKVLTNLRGGKFEQSELEAIRGIAKTPASKGNTIVYVVCALFLIEKFAGAMFNEWITILLWRPYMNYYKLRVIYYFIQILSCLLGVALLSKFKQSTVLAGSCFVMAICNITMGSIGFNMWDPTLAITFGGIWTITYYTGLALIPMVLMAEMLPVYQNPMGLAAAASANWFFWALATLLKREMFLSLENDIYWLHTAFSILGIIVAAIWVPDTRKKSLKENVDM